MSRPEVRESSRLGAGRALARRFVVADGGICAQARQCPSPNFDQRPEPCEVSLLVVHHISLPAGEFGTPYVEQLFRNELNPAAHPSFQDLAGLQVSAHFLIDRHGGLTQFVACDQRAWHAGASSFNQRERCNDFSIGVELEGCYGVPFEALQYEVLKRLIHALWRAYPLQHVVGHSDIAPGRKIDPGPSFDWAHLRQLTRLPMSAFPFGLSAR